MNVFKRYNTVSKEELRLLVGESPMRQTPMWTLKRKMGWTIMPNPAIFLEAATGFEPVNNGFADRSLATWVCRQLIVCIMSPP